MILESGATKCIALGVVFEDVGTQLSLGEEGTVGYSIISKKIYDSSLESDKETIGMYMYVDRFSQMCLDYVQEQLSVELYVSDTQNRYLYLHFQVQFVVFSLNEVPTCIFCGPSMVLGTERKKFHFRILLLYLTSGTSTVS